MKTYVLLALLVSSFIPTLVQADAQTINQLLQVYETQGATNADAEQGKQFWQKTFTYTGEFAERSCASCHSLDLSSTGKHIKTGKQIKPMAPSVNPERLNKSKKIEKWFKRNCKWTVGRECSAQEKANILIYINNQT